jgi:hypothetical protein
MTLVITHIETNADEGVLVKVMTPQEIVDVLVQLDEGISTTSTSRFATGSIRRSMRSTRTGP